MRNQTVGLLILHPPNLPAKTSPSAIKHLIMTAGLVGGLFCGYKPLFPPAMQVVYFYCGYNYNSTAACGAVKLIT